MLTPISSEKCGRGDLAIASGSHANQKSGQPDPTNRLIKLANSGKSIFEINSEMQAATGRVLSKGQREAINRIRRNRQIAAERSQASGQRPLQRNEWDRTEQALNRRARRTGQDISVNTRLNMDPTGRTQDISPVTLRGRSTRGGWRGR